MVQYACSTRMNDNERIDIRGLGNNGASSSSPKKTQKKNPKTTTGSYSNAHSKKDAKASANRDVNTGYSNAHSKKDSKAAANRSVNTSYANAHSKRNSTESADRRRTVELKGQPQSTTTATRSKTPDRRRTVALKGEPQTTTARSSTPSRRSRTPSRQTTRRSHSSGPQQRHQRSRSANPRVSSIHRTPRGAPAPSPKVKKQPPTQYTRRVGEPQTIMPADGKGPIKVIVPIYVSPKTNNKQRR